METAKYSLIIPVYRNEDSLPELLGAIKTLNLSLHGKLEAVFVIDGSPDRSFQFLEGALPNAQFTSQIILLSRNFGSFEAIRCGLGKANGPFFAVMAADLQEPPELALRFFETLETDKADVVIGVRKNREDPLISRTISRTFWWIYRKFVQHEMPPGGFDVFGCNDAFRKHLLTLRESNSTLVGLVFWLGFRRKFVEYERKARKHGVSAWTFSKKLRYFLDSIFAFSDLPVRILVMAGLFGVFVSVGLATIILAAKLSGLINVPGYTATLLTIAFFAALNLFGIGIIGSYVWRAFENTKGRPASIIMNRIETNRKESKST